MSVLHTGLAPLEIAMRLQLKVPARSQALQDMHGQELSRPAIGLHDVLEMQEGRSHDDYERGPLDLELPQLLLLTHRPAQCRSFGYICASRQRR